MASRVRRSTATPVALRRTQQDVPAPDYEPPQFTLNPDAQRKLNELTRKYQLKKLDDRYDDAQAAISNCASEINDRLTDKARMTQKAKNKSNTQTAGSQDGDIDGTNGNQEELEANLEALREKVTRMTQRMDEGMRKLIDGQHSVQAISGQVTAVANDARNLASTQASTLAARSQSRRRRDADGDEDMDDEDEPEYDDFTPTDPAGTTQTIPSTSAAFLRKLEDERTRYQNFTLTQRYAQNNNYRNFKGLVHAAQYPNEEVDLPHESEWFPDGGRAPAPGVTRRLAIENEDDDDDDIQIQRATTSTKCPLTLQEFKEPLSSTRCSHSFESSAILEMIGRSNERGGGQPGPRGGMVGGERAVRCPVASCNVMLKKSDLHKDLVIVHRIKRLQHAKRLEEEEAEEEREQWNGQTTVIDDDADDAADVEDYEAGIGTKPERVKDEPRSTAGTGRVNVTQRPPASSAVVDFGESTDEEEEDDG